MRDDRREQLAGRLDDVRRRIAQAANRAGRDPDEVTLVVVAKTPPKDGRDQFTAFIVDGEATGLRVEQRCRFMGMRGIYNAALSFRDVRIPAEDMLGDEGRGMKLALTLLALRVLGADRRLRVSDTWGCGRIGQTARQEYTATAFAEPLRRIFAELYRPTRNRPSELLPDTRT